MMRVLGACIGIVVGGALFSAPSSVTAAPSSITYVTGHHLHTLSLRAHPSWRAAQRVYSFRGRTALLPEHLQGSGDTVLPPEWSERQVSGWNEDAIAATTEDVLGGALNRLPGTVTISRSATGAIVFEGAGFPGRIVDARRAARLTIQALRSDIDVVVLPIIEQPPTITVLDPELGRMGIREVVSVGESSFRGSPKNRRHNIGVGVRTINGSLIPQGATFSFNEALGPVGEATGYKKELVIQGRETIPDYGGGLCQVSTTLYRGAWEEGLPIVGRKNHSYAVSYYSPQGTDATIYPPRVDLRFTNDTPGALLIQGVVDEKDHAAFILYGTKDTRKTEVVGPFISDRKAAPTEDLIIPTIDLPPGERKQVGEAHDGLRAVWYRIVEDASGKRSTDRTVSTYEARPRTWQEGRTKEEMERLTGTDASSEPSWLPSTP